MWSRPESVRSRGSRIRFTESNGIMSLPPNRMETCDRSAHPVWKWTRSVLSSLRSASRPPPPPIPLLSSLPARDYGRWSEWTGLLRRSHCDIARYHAVTVDIPRYPNVDVTLRTSHIISLSLFTFLASTYHVCYSPAMGGLFCPRILLFLFLFCWNFQPKRPGA
jgi:hypothetical protein